MSTVVAGAVLPFQNPNLPLEERVADLVSRLTLEEKLGMMASRQPAVARLGIPEFHIGGEAAHGLIASDGYTTVFPQTQGLACTWDQDLMYRVGVAISDEARAFSNKRRGLSGLCLWAPTIDMERDPRWGRNEEAYGEDPVLAGRLSGAYIRGMQGNHPFYLKTVPTPKHFYANNNEKNRSSASASMDPRLRREYYLAPFEMAVREYGVSSIMTAYNRINGIPAMLHPDLLETVKGEWGMEGFIVCDGAGLTQLVDTHKYFDDYAMAAAKSLERGVDNFSDDAHKITPIVKEAFSRALIQEEDLDRALSNVFRVRFRLGQFDPPEDNPYGGLGESVICSPTHLGLSREAARKSIVLLRNEVVDGKPILPLDEKKITRLALIGPLAATVYRDWYTGQPHYQVSPLAALAERLGPERITHHDASDVVVLRHADGGYLGPTGWYDGTIAVNRRPGEAGEQFWRTDFGWGNQTLRSFSSGCYLNLEDNGIVAASAKEVYAWYVKSRFDLRPVEGEPGAHEIYAWDGRPLGLNLQRQLAAVGSDGTEPLAPRLETLYVDVIRDGIDAAVEAASLADAAIVFVGNNPVLVAKEEFDRPSIDLPPKQQELLQAVAKANPKTVGVIISSYPYALKGLEREVPALLYMSHGGPEGGRALADILLGDSSPAGRLPMTWYRDGDELPDIMDYDIRRKPRTYQFYEGRVLYPFGYGLSYTQFEYEGLRLSTGTLNPGAEWMAAQSPGPQGASGSSMASASGDEVKVLVQVRNAGSIAAEEVVQLYASCRSSRFSRPRKQLLAFQRLHIEAGERIEVEFTVKAEAFRVWDPSREGWLLETSSWSLAAGPHSECLPVQADLEVQGASPGIRSPGQVLGPEAVVDCHDLLFDEEEGEFCLRPTKANLPARISFGEFEFPGGLVPIKILAAQEGQGSISLRTALDGEATVVLELHQEPGQGFRELAVELPVPAGICPFILELDGSIMLKSVAIG